MSKKSKAEKAEAKRLEQLAAEKADRKAGKAFEKACKKAGKKGAPVATGTIVDDAGNAWHGEKGADLPIVSQHEAVIDVDGVAAVVEPKTAKHPIREVVEAELADAADLSTMSDADIKARVKAKTEARKAREADLAAHEATRDSVDRDDEQAVARYNEAIRALGGGHFLTSTAERDRRADFLREKAADPEVWAAPSPEAAVAELNRLAQHVAEVVATEEGDIIAVGPERTPLADVSDETIALPSDAPKVLEQNGNGQYKIKRPTDGRIVGYTRATTYIDNLEDKSAIEKWKARTILEGLAVVEVEQERVVLADVRDHLHRRDVAIAKAHKADRKGKLKPGQLGDLIADAEREWKKAAESIAEDMLQAGGAHAKREKGTDLHALCEVADLKGIAAVEAKVEAGEATPADLADVKAYLAACEKAGLKVVEVETVVVNDELKVAGRLDRVVMYKRPGSARAGKVVGDVKTGRVDYSAGKIAQQIRLYATGERYDLDTHERTPLGVSKTLGLLIHLPAGKAECTIYEVDLTLGAKGVKLSGDVRAWRSEGKRAFDLKAPIAHVALAEGVAS